MRERAEILGYTERGPHVVRVSGHHVELFTGDARPAVDEAVRIAGAGASAGAEVHARVLRHLGNGRSDALVLELPAWLEPGCPVHCTGEAATWPAPRDGALEMACGWAPGEGLPLRVEAPMLADVDAARPALPIGLEALDLLAPIAARGVTLVVDATQRPRVFDALCAAVSAHLRPDASLTVADAPSPHHTHTVVHTTRRDEVSDHLAIRAAMVLGANLRPQHAHTLVTMTLPELRAPDAYSFDAFSTREGLTLGEVTTRITDALTSTRGHAVTTLLRLPLSPTLGHLATVLETLGMGAVDAMIFLDADGQLRAESSRSVARHEDPALASEGDALRRALAESTAMQDHLAIFGMDDLDDERSDLLTTLAALETDALVALQHHLP